MCVIAVKYHGQPLPTEDKVEAMWTNNPDGAGFMFIKDSAVQIRKGFMKLKAFKKALRELEKEVNIMSTPVILHFRIGTSGGNIPENTHPFPISDHLPVLQKLTCRTTLAIAHNGIIPITPSNKNISDTMEYVTSQLSPLYQLKKDFYKSVNGKKLIYNFTMSKFAFMDFAGNIELIGDFHECDGIYYSNHSYRPYTKFRNWDIWDDYLYTPTDNIKALNWLDEGEYIINSDGNMIEGIEYLIDRHKNVYKYDWQRNAAKMIEAVAFNPRGLPLTFCEENIDYVQVYQSEPPKKVERKG